LCFNLEAKTEHESTSKYVFTKEAQSSSNKKRSRFYEEIQQQLATREIYKFVFVLKQCVYENTQNYNE
jgi:mitochondrial fission protein ELM1